MWQERLADARAGLGRGLNSRRLLQARLAPLPQDTPYRSRWRRGALPSGAVIVAVAIVILGLGWGVKAKCLRSTPGSHGVPALDWSGGYPFNHFCYSDVVPLYGIEGFSKAGTFPYKTSWLVNAGTPFQQRHYTEYPVLTGLFMWVNAKLTHAYSALARAGIVTKRMPEMVYFNLVSLWLAAAWAVVAWAAMKLAGARKWDAVLVAASPLLLAQAFTNFDALAVAFATLGMLAWARRRPALAGVLLGLGGATKLYPLFLLVPLLALCLRERQRRPAVRLAAGAAGAWAAVNVPIAALFPSGWAWFYKFSEQRGPGFESLYSIASYFTHWGGFDGPLAPNEAPAVLNTVSGLLFIACCAAVVAIALLAPRRPRVPQLCLLMIVAFLLTSKIYSPQYSLWLVPLAVLALPRPWLLLGWMTIDTLVWVPWMLFQLPAGHGRISYTLFSAIILLRDTALLVLCAAVLREIFRPDKDLVRTARGEDPAGGVLNGAEGAVLSGPRPAAVATPS